MSRVIKYRQPLKDEYKKVHGDSFHYWGYIDGGFTSPLGKNHIVGDSQQFTGLQDCKGVDIYESDLVYIAGTGVIEMEFPFIDLYEAYPEGDIGEIKGNIYENIKGE